MGRVVQNSGFLIKYERMNEMNKRTVIIIACILIFTLIIGSTVVLARDGNAKIDVMYRNIKLMVNGANVPATGENEPFIYGGRTYVPLRLVSEALGYNVDWDSSTFTVIIGDSAAPPPAPTPSTSLSKIKPYHHTALSIRESITYDTNANMSMVNERYYDGMQVAKDVVIKKPDSLELYFNLDAKYSKLTGLVGFDDTSARLVESMIVTFYGDDRLITRLELKPEDPKPKALDLDVRNVSVLKIELLDQHGDNTPYRFYAELINFANANLK